jgi:hypothetical protein
VPIQEEHIEYLDNLVMKVADNLDRLNWVKMYYPERLRCQCSLCHHLMMVWNFVLRDCSLLVNHAASRQRVDLRQKYRLVVAVQPTEGPTSADQSAVDQAIKDANQAVSDLAQTSVPPSVVQQQQDDTSAANQHVADLQHDLQEANNPSGQSSTPSSDDGTGNTDTSVVPDNTSSPNSSDPNYQPPSSPNYPGTRYVPPESAQDPDKPKLIEGANGVQ